MGTIAPYAFWPEPATIVAAMVFCAMSVQSLMALGEAGDGLAARAVDTPEQAGRVASTLPHAMSASRIRTRDMASTSVSGRIEIGGKRGEKVERPDGRYNRPTRDLVEDITGLLVAWGHGDEAALQQLIPLVHRELHQIARRCLKGERPGHTLQPTALVNEAYLRLVNVRRVSWKNRTHFLAMSARLMRRVLVDFARSRQYQ